MLAVGSVVEQERGAFQGGVSAEAHSGARMGRPTKPTTAREAYWCEEGLAKELMMNERGDGSDRGKRVGWGAEPLRPAVVAAAAAATSTSGRDTWRSGPPRGGRCAREANRRSRAARARTRISHRPPRRTRSATPPMSSWTPREPLPCVAIPDVAPFSSHFSSSSRTHHDAIASVSPLVPPLPFHLPLCDASPCMRLGLSSATHAHSVCFRVAPLLPCVLFHFALSIPMCLWSISHAAISCCRGLFGSSCFFL